MPGNPRRAGGGRGGTGQGLGWLRAGRFRRKALPSMAARRPQKTSAPGPGAIGPGTPRSCSPRTCPAPTEARRTCGTPGASARTCRQGIRSLTGPLRVQVEAVRPRPSPQGLSLSLPGPREGQATHHHQHLWRQPRTPSVSSRLTTRTARSARSRTAATGPPERADAVDTGDRPGLRIPMAWPSSFHSSGSGSTGRSLATASKLNCRRTRSEWRAQRTQLSPDRTRALTYR